MKISLSRLDEDLGVLSEIESVVLSKDMGPQALHESKDSTGVFFWASEICSEFPRERIHCASEDGPRGGYGRRSKEKECGQSCLLSQRPVRHAWVSPCFQEEETTF